MSGKVRPIHRKPGHTKISQTRRRPPFKRRKLWNRRRRRPGVIVVRNGGRRRQFQRRRPNSSPHRNRRHRSTTERGMTIIGSILRAIQSIYNRTIGRVFGSTNIKNSNIE